MLDEVSMTSSAKMLNKIHDQLKRAFANELPFVNLGFVLLWNSYQLPQPLYSVPPSLRIEQRNLYYSEHFRCIHFITAQQRVATDPVHVQIF